mmetsp:Transcript_36187/g.69724  ORF Transcript_36187/g.69724 Transcript_36187/m.69724 type:complete len:122 (-) Transcript_36187:724-1089(-)
MQVTARSWQYRHRCGRNVKDNCAKRAQANAHARATAAAAAAAAATAAAFVQHDSGAELCWSNRLRRQPICFARRARHGPMALWQLRAQRKAEKEQLGYAEFAPIHWMTPAQLGYVECAPMH